MSVDVTPKILGKSIAMGVEPFTSEDAAFLLPPQRYKEVMGVYQTSTKLKDFDSPPLSYIEVMPRCLDPGNIAQKVRPTYDSFSNLLIGANKWLKDHRSLFVWKCETVQRRVTTDDVGNLNYDLDKMIRIDSAHGYQVFVRGLRLWLTKDPHWSSGSALQKLCLLNVVPDRVEVEMPTVRPPRYATGLCAGGRVGDDELYLQHLSTFEGLGKTVEKINALLRMKPLQGKILSIETDTIQTAGGGRADLDPDGMCWTEEELKYRRLTQVVRLFYIHIGLPVKEQIGLQEFIPKMVPRGDAVTTPTFEPMSNVITNLAQWVSSNQDVRIVNFQQYDAKVHTLLGIVDIASDSTDESISLFGENRMVRTIRCFYVKSSDGVPKTASSLTSRLFLPCRTVTTEFETMNETMHRIDSWLRVTGLSIYSVETVPLLFDPEIHEGVDWETADYTISRRYSQHWLTGIRVFFPNEFQEPDPYTLPPKPVYQPEPKPQTCSCVIG